MDLEERKKALRQEIKAAAAALDEGYTKEADLEIFSHVAGLPEYEQAGTLFCFVGTSGEIDTVPILEDALRKENGWVFPSVRPEGSWKFVKSGALGIWRQENTVYWSRGQMRRSYSRRKLIWPLCHVCHAAMTAGVWGTAAGTMTAIWSGPGP